VIHLSHEPQLFQVIFSFNRNGLLVPNSRARLRHNPLALSTIQEILMRSMRTVLLTLGLCGLTHFSLAQTVDVQGAWARASVPGQKATGAFMTLTSRDGATLVGAASAVAQLAEVHEMKLDGDVMKMRALPMLELPAGKPVVLKPGSYHIMLQDLKAPLAKDSVIPLTLILRDSKGSESRVELKVPVQIAAPSAPSGPSGHMAEGTHQH
jgi:copper(I)-binding protein